MTEGPTYYSHLTFNAPLSEGRAEGLAERLAAHAPVNIVDVGCGWGDLLLRVLVRSTGSSGIGVDTDEAFLDRARSAAEARGLGDRAGFERRSAAEITESADLVICVGSSHALDEDLSTALSRLRELVRRGGRLLLGEGFWEPRGLIDESRVWDDVLAMPNLGGLVDACVVAGFRPLFVETANQDEWETFESSYLADSEEWLMTHAGHPRAEKERAEADDHRGRWLHGYRNGLGFAYLTLGVPG